MQRLLSTVYFFIEIFYLLTLFSQSSSPPLTALSFLFICLSWAVLNTQIYGMNGHFSTFYRGTPNIPYRSLNRVFLKSQIILLNIGVEFLNRELCKYWFPFILSAELVLKYSQILSAKPRILFKINPHHLRHGLGLLNF